MKYGDPQLSRDLLDIHEPKVLKQRVKRLKNYNEADWMNYIPIMLKPALSASKFEQNEILRDALVATGSTVLAEASPYDTLFGIGLGLNNPLALDQSSWHDKNLQGSGTPERT